LRPRSVVIERAQDFVGLHVLGFHGGVGVLLELAVEVLQVSGIHARTDADRSHGPNGAGLVIVVELPEYRNGYQDRGCGERDRKLFV
jgi:hypothetical protein